MCCLHLTLARSWKSVPRCNASGGGDQGHALIWTARPTGAAEFSGMCLCFLELTQDSAPGGCFARASKWC